MLQKYIIPPQPLVKISVKFQKYFIASHSPSLFALCGTPFAIHTLEKK